MITLSGQILVVVFSLLAGAMLLFSLAHLYHALRFGSRDPLMMTTTGIFIAGIVALLFISISLLVQVNWSSNVNVTSPSVHLNLPDVNSLPDINSLRP